ncbi:MAG TPA: ATP-binding protein [Pedobacter sp.]|jgi:PAS domain S-box-containing protein
MNKVKKSLYTNEEMIDRFRKAAEELLSNDSVPANASYTNHEIQELVHQIQVQHLELEMQNDELKISNQEVENQRHRFEGLYDLAPVGYFILDKHGLIEEVNTTGCNLLETTKRTALNRRFQGFIQSNDTDFFYHFLQRISKTEIKQSCQLALVTPKGNTLHAQIEGIAVRNALLQKEQYYIAVIDITEQRQAELKLTETNGRLEMALDASATGTWQLDLRTEEISLDHFSCEIYGLKECDANISLQSFVNIIHPDDRKLASKLFGEAISQKQDLDVEFRIVLPDSTIRFISARGHLIDNDEKAMCFIGILMNITTRKLLEVEAIRLKESQRKDIMHVVLQTQEKERKRISESLHDSVSQLLYGIKLKLQHFKGNKEGNYSFDDVFVLIEQAVTETRNISFELAPSILSDFGLPITLKEMADKLSTSKLKIKTRVSGMQTRLPLDFEINLFRIIQELVNNTIKHAQATEVMVEVTKKNELLNISVRDNGIGFKPAELDSSGSGLHSIKNRLDVLNGTMEIKSGEGDGSVVYIRFKDVPNL